MATEDPGLSEALDRVRLALAEMASGNPEPYLACWADSDDVTLFGAWGPIERRPRVHRGLRARRGDRRRRPAAADDDRVTHIYRRIGGTWRLVHRHADFPPLDQRGATR
jgi:hypothetical protein